VLDRASTERPKALRIIASRLEEQPFGLSMSVPSGLEEYLPAADLRPKA